jgi:hypothetical protein
MTIERYVFLIGGSVVLISVLLAAYQDIRWLWLTGLMGAHLIQLSFTGFCPIAMLLGKLGVPSRPCFSR